MIKDDRSRTARCGFFASFAARWGKQGSRGAALCRQEACLLPDNCILPD